MHIHRFTVSVNCNLYANTENTTETYEDNGFIIFPDTYEKYGTSTRLVMNCHGAGGTVTTDDSQTEHQLLAQYLVANGYAVMDVNGLPQAYAEKNGIDLRNNIGSPIAIECYVKAYHYCIENFNLYPEVFVHGASMGGISSTNLVLSERIPVIAHSAFCPVLDTYNQIFLHPWSGGLPKYALGKIYGLDIKNGEYIYDEEKMMRCNPIKNPKAQHYPVPVKFWHCEDDEVVAISVTRSFIDKIMKSGRSASLRTFENGGHEPQLAGEYVEKPCGNVIFNQGELKITPAVEEAFAWIKSFG